MRPAVLAVLVALWPLAAPTPGAAQDDRLRDYTVRPGDSCASIARRMWGDAQAFDLIHRHNPGLGPTPHRLTPGTVLRIPSPLSPGADARLSAVRRQVQARSTAGAAWASAATGQALSRGYQVRTLVDSSAEVTFRDATTVAMRENTLVIIYGGSRALSRVARATLERGALRSRLDELAGQVSITTPSSEATLGHGVAVVSVDADGTSRVANHEGEATVGAGGRRLVVPAGTGTIVEQGTRPSAPRPLPAAPRWRVDLAGRFVGLTGRGGTLAGSWHPAEGARSYRVEVARRPDGGEVVAAVVVPASVDRFEVHGVPAGVYYIGVATIDRYGLEGRTSPRRAMRVLEARIIPPGGAEPIERPYDPGDPSVPVVAPSVLPGTWIVAPIGLRCGTTAPPAGMSTLTRPGTHRVRCVDSRDREVPAFDVEVVEVTASLHPTDLRLVPGERARVELELPEGVPDQLVVVAPEGLEVDRVARRVGARFTLGVRAPVDPAVPVEVQLAVTAGTALVPLTTVRIPVAAPAPVSPPPAPPPRPAPAAPPPPVQDALARAPLPEVIALRDDGRTGHAAWASLTALSPEPGAGEVQTRAALGVDVALGREPVRLEAAASVDPTGAHEARARRGHGDLRLRLSWTASRGPRMVLAPDFGLWIPTGLADRELPSARLVQSLGVRAVLPRGLSLRTRQGVVFGFSEDDALLWASAYGLDAYVWDRLALGLEVDASLGRGADGDMVAVAAGLGARLRLGVVELAAAGRLAMTDDARRSMGRYLITLGASATWRRRR